VQDVLGCDPDQRQSRWLKATGGSETSSAASEVLLQHGSLIASQGLLLGPNGAARMHVHAHAHTHTHVHTHSRTHAQHTCTHTHARTHTHTHVHYVTHMLRTPHTHEDTETHIQAAGWRTTNTPSPLVHARRPCRSWPACRSRSKSSCSTFLT